MQNQEQTLEDGQIECVASPVPEFEEWANFGDDDIIQQRSVVQAEEAKKIPFVGDKASPILLLLENDLFCYVVIFPIISPFYYALCCN